MSHEGPSPKHITLDEIESLGAVQTRARARGLVAVLTGAASALALIGAFLLLSRDRPTVSLPARSVEAQPTIEPAPAAETQRPSAAMRPPGKRRSKDLVAALAAPVEPPRPASSTPVRRSEPPVSLQELARSVAAQKTGAVQLCFERELKRDPRVRGSATVTLELRAPRQLERVDVHDTLGRKTFTSCVAQAMRTIDLPSLTEDVSMQIPFALKAPEL